MLRLIPQCSPALVFCQQHLQFASYLPSLPNVALGQGESLLCCLSLVNSREENNHFGPPSLFLYFCVLKKSGALYSKPV